MHIRCLCAALPPTLLHDEPSIEVMTLMDLERITGVIDVDAPEARFKARSGVGTDAWPRVNRLT